MFPYIGWISCAPTKGSEHITLSARLTRGWREPWPSKNRVDIRNDPSPHEWRVNNFDLVRLFAALQVAIVHALASLTPTRLVVNVLRYGLSFFPGVPIFFVVSGVLISRSYEQSEFLRDYFRNRCLRISPALWVCLIVSLGVICLSEVSTLGTVSTWEWSLWWMAQMSIFQSYQPHFLNAFGNGGRNASLWTIPIELEFYLLLPVLYRVLRPQRQCGHALMLAVLLVSLALELIVVRGPKHLGSIAGCDLLRLTLLPYLWRFLLGVLIQRNWYVLRGKLIGRAHCTSTLAAMTSTRFSCCPWPPWSSLSPCRSAVCPKGFCDNRTFRTGCISTMR
jgi:peptidoglycan/LPS O-acetylase OafA/YrhL